MFRAIGIIVIIYAISVMLSDSFDAFDGAATAAFQAIESAAVVSKTEIEKGL